MHEEITIPELTDVVAHVAAILGTREGAVTALDGGITNRNFRVRFGGTDYVVRLPGKDTGLLGINRETERIANTRAAELGIAPPVAAAMESPACLITRFVPGRELTAEELRQPDNLAEVARALRAFHESGLELPTEFDSFQVVEDYAATAGARGTRAPPEYSKALGRARAIRKAVSGQEEHRPVPCHDDLLSANLLHDGRHVKIVDWEYAGMGDRYFDLGNFAVNNELGESEEDMLLSEYFGEPATDRRRATLALFRFMSDFREAMWGVVQSAVSEIDFDFTEYARMHFARLTAAAADPRFEVRLREARGAGP
jgi:thiamine kinase-like enzyme